MTPVYNKIWVRVSRIGSVSGSAHREIFPSALRDAFGNIEDTIKDQVTAESAS